MTIPVKQSTAVQNLMFMMISSTDHITGVTGATVTGKVSKNGATGVSPTGTITQVDATNNPGLYKLAANATDSNTLGPLWGHFTATGCDPTDVLLAEIVAFDPQDGVHFGLTALPNAAAASAGGIPTSGTGANQIQPRRVGLALSGGTSAIGLAAGTIVGIGDEIDIIGGTGNGQSGIALTVTGSGGSTPAATMVQSWQTANPDGTSLAEVKSVGQLVPSQPSDVWNSGSAPTRVVTAATNITSDGTSAARQTDTAALATLIGSPATGTVGGAIAAVQTTASAGATTTALTALSTKIGTPAGASVSADIAAVQATASAGATTTALSALNTKIGTPAGASVSADIAAVNTAVASTATAANLAVVNAKLPAALVGGRISSDVGSVVGVVLQQNGSGTQNIGGP